MLAATTCLLFWSNSHDAFALSDIRTRIFVTWFCMPSEIFYIHNCVLNRAVILAFRNIRYISVFWYLSYDVSSFLFGSNASPL